MIRRGISPAITTIVLLGVAVIGALTAGNAMSAQNQITQTTTKADLIEVDLVNLPSPGKSYFSVTVKNSGTTILNYLSVGFLDDTGSFQDITVSYLGLQPGEQWSNYIVANVEVDSGKNYAIHLDGSTDTVSTGSTYRIADTVVARG